MKFGTKLIHEQGIDKHIGALSVPIYQVSTYHQADIENPPEFDYSRSGNPTRKTLEDIVAKLENGDRGFAFSSGMAATSSVFSIFSSGDHIIISRDVYGGTFRVVTGLFKRFGIEVSFVDTSNTDEIEKAIKRNTKCLFLETPSNPLLKITDLKGAIRIAKQRDLVVIVDNTFMSPYLQRPIELGADIVVHSATKFIGGHSDVVGGLVVAKGRELVQKIYSVQNGFGAILGPHDCWLLLRGLKTLKVRLDNQEKNAHSLAQWLVQQKEVTKVYYPGLPFHPGSEVHLGQAEGSGAVLSFKTQDIDLAKAWMKNVRLAAIAVSLGGVETIVSYPVKMSHASMPSKEREQLGITDDLIRISVGLEDIDDLIEDFERAFHKATKL